MTVNGKKVLVLLTLVVCMVILSMIFLHHPGKTGAYAAVPNGHADATPVSSCANVACNDACWVDGTHHNPGTYAQYKIITPDGCSGPGGCVTQPCN